MRHVPLFVLHASFQHHHRVIWSPLREQRNTVIPTWHQSESTRMAVPLMACFTVFCRAARSMRTVRVSFMNQLFLGRCGSMGKAEEAALLKPPMT